VNQGPKRFLLAQLLPGGAANQAKTVVTTLETISGTWASGSQASRVRLCAQQFATISVANTKGAVTAISTAMP
jgi:hypothetical protein